MKQKQTITALLSFFSMLFFAVSANAQTATPVSYHQKDFIADNPTADRDLQTVDNYIRTLETGDAEKARSLLAPNFMIYGPGPRDSADANKETNAWRENFKTHTDRKVNFVLQTFRVLAGDLQGNWVSAWGDYNTTINGIRLKIPFQTTYHVTDDGKIDRAGTYYDRQAIMEALGFRLVPPTPAAPNKGKKK